MMLRYTVLVEPEDDGSAYDVLVPVLPGCFTWGATVEEALANAREAITCHLKGLAKDGEPTPQELVTPLFTVVDVPVDLDALTGASERQPAATAAS